MKLRFRLVAFEETAHWADDIQTKADGPIFGVYLFCEGEATFCCSLSPSQWCEFVENHFPADLPEKIDAELSELARENGGEHGRYYAFQCFELRDRRFQSSDSITLKGRVRDYPGRTWADKREACREALWTEARETAATGALSNVIPVTCQPNVWRDYQRKQNRPARHLPLFANL